MSVYLVFAVLFVLSVGLPDAFGFPQEIFWGLALLIVLILRTLQTRDSRVHVPTTMLYLWMLFLAAMLGVTAFSHSVGQSILTVVRYVECFTVFLLCVSSTKHERTHIDIIFKKTALATWILFIIYWYANTQGMHTVAPSLVSISGHHPISYAAIVFVPFFVFGQSAFPFLLLVVAIAVLSGSRIALLLLGLFLFGLLIRDKINFKFHKKILTSVLFLSCLILVSSSLLPYSVRSRFITNYPFLTSYFKDFTSDRLRVNYAKQAIQAIRTYPITGYGPGTFELVSRRFQTKPAEYSKYAHSLPLEFLAEHGVITFVFFLMLFGLVVYRSIWVIRRYDSSLLPIAWSLLLISIYATVDVGLNHLPYLLFYWALAGILFAGYGAQRALSLIPSLVGFGIFMLGVCISLSYRGPDSPFIRFMFAPYRKDLAIQSISSPTPSRFQFISSIIEALYSQDPDVRMVQAKKFNNITLIEQTLINDQYNYPYWVDAFIASQTGNPDNLSRILCRFVQIHLPHETCTELLTPRVHTFLQSQAFVRTLDQLYGADGAAKFIYSVGLSYYETTDDTYLPLILWRLARDIAPQWGYYHLELASGLVYWHNDKTAAEQVLRRCMTSSISKNGCLITKGYTETLSFPGSLRYDIFAIPYITP